MNYTKQIFEMLGVEPKEEFKLKSRTGKISDTSFKIEEDLDVIYFDFGDWYKCEESVLQEILTGEREIIKIPHPTKEEQLAIDYARACGFKWIAKDKNKTVTAFKEKPKKGTKEWLNTTNDLDDWIELYLPISFIHWEDEEPFYIEKDETKETEETKVKKVCEFYSEGKCMARIYHPNVVCEGNKNRCYAG